MHCSEARLAANRRNALRSTGPRTPEGKAVSRANALKHGLCATVCGPEDATLVKQRADDYLDALKPQNEYQTWMVEQVAILSVKIDRCERIERGARDKLALRAGLTWEDDRRLEAEVLGSSLPKRPSETVEALRRTPQGCEWLMTRWAMLAHAADNHPDHAWTDEQTALAFDLLATPSAFRSGKPGATIDFEGKLLDPAHDSSSVARRMVAELKARRDVVEGLDEVERALTEADMTLENDPELRRLRRYESTLQRRLRWAVGQVNPKASTPKPSSNLTPKRFEVSQPTPTFEPLPSPAEKPAEVPEVYQFEPPFFLGMNEAFELIRQKAQPEVVTPRREKQLRKAQGRRDARLRKLEKLRA